MLLFSNSVRPEVVVGILIALLMFVRNKLKFLIFIQYLNMMAYIVSILKTVMIMPRPYMVNP